SALPHSLEPTTPPSSPGADPEGDYTALNGAQSALSSRRRQPLLCTPAAGRPGSGSTRFLRTLGLAGLGRQPGGSATSRLSRRIPPSRRAWWGGIPPPRGRCSVLRR